MQESYHLPLFEGKGLRHSFMPINRQSSLPTLSYRVGLLTQEENLKNVDNIYIITKKRMAVREGRPFSVIFFST